MIENVSSTMVGEWLLGTIGAIALLNSAMAVRTWRLLNQRLPPTPTADWGNACAALESTSLAIAIYDRNGQAVYLNRAFCQLFDYTLAEFNRQGGGRYFIQRSRFGRTNSTGCKPRAVLARRCAHATSQGRSHPHLCPD